MHEVEQHSAAGPARGAPERGAPGPWQHGAVIPAASSPVRRPALLRAGAAMALALSLVLGGGAAAHADPAWICVDNACDGGLWEAARGDANQISYWGMGAGHNCTNYAAWKLIGNGVGKPATPPGNAAEWASHAIADGYEVNSIPAEGAIAQWGSYEGGNPYEGHVAYVERVNDDGTLLISEDAWHYDGSGPLRYRVIPSSSVPRFIHYGDTADWLRQAVGAPGDWAERGTMLLPDAALLSGVSMGGSTQVAYLQGGELRIATADGAGWRTASTGLPSTARALSAVNMGGTAPTIMTVEGTKLMVASLGHAGWTSMYTGLDVSGEMSAVNAGGPWPTVMVAQGGDLYRLANHGTGWTVELTGVQTSGPIAAVSTGGALIDTFAIENGTLYRLWTDGTWWHKDSTGVPAHGAIAAAPSEGSAQVVLAQDGALSLVFRDSLGWQGRPLGIDAGASLTAVDLGGIYPVVLQAG